MATTKTTKTAIITLPNRTIKSGEYGASYGSGRTHEEIFFSYFKQTKTMQVSKQKTNDAITLTINYAGKLGQRNIEEIERFYNHGFLLDLVY